MMIIDSLCFIPFILAFSFQLNGVRSMASSIKDQSENVMSRQEEMLKVYDRKARMLEKKVRQSMQDELTRFHPEMNT